MTWRKSVASLASRFARVTSSVAYIPQIDGLRAVAMMLVLAHHVSSIYLEQTHRLGTQSLPQDWDKIALRSELVGWILNLGIGVPIFCVISGFILSIPYARAYSKGRNPQSVWIYLLRRLIRMEPPYVVSMTILLLMVLMPWRMGWGFAGGMFHLYAPHYFASLVYLHAQIFGTPSWVNGVAWTLEIEFQFYLMLPVLAHLYRMPNTLVRRSTLIALVLLAALFAQYTLPALHNARFDLSIFKQLQYFLAGMLLADIQLNPPKSFQISARSADVVAAVAIALLIYVLHWHEHLAMLQPFLVAALFFAVFRADLFARLLSSLWLTVPGAMCYTIYLYHFFIIGRLLPFTLRLVPPVHPLFWDLLVQMVILLIPVILIAAVLYLLAERPFVVLSHSIADRFRKQRTTAVPAIAHPMGHER